MLEEKARLEEKEKEEERLKMEREVRESLEKELRARLKEEAEQKEKEEAREAELSGSVAGIRQKPCRHGYQCRLFWVSWSHCALTPVAANRAEVVPSLILLPSSGGVVTVIGRRC